MEDEEWISFIDADDYIGPSMYESIFQAIGKENVDYVRLFSRRTPERYNPQTTSSDESKGVNYKIVLSEDYFVHESVGGYTHSLFVKKCILDDYKLSFPEKMVMLEDQAFSITCATHAKKILLLDQPRNYYYYSGNESSITRKSKDTSDDIIRCLNIVYKAFTTTGSSVILNDYFYSKYLPIKLDSLYGKRLLYRNNPTKEKLLPEIKIRFSSLSFKTKLKYVIVKVLRLIKTTIIRLMQKDKTLITQNGGHRINYLDIAKGVLIILLVFAHFRSALNRTDFENGYFKYVYGWNSIFTCFYMPAFFLISGYCSNFKKDLKTFLKSLFKSLVLPLFALSLVNDISYALMVTHQDLPTALLKTIKSGGTLWFIQALIIAKVICYIIQKATDSRIVMLIAILVLLTTGITLHQFNIGSNLFYYQHELVASFFVALGLYLKEAPSIYEKALKYSLYAYPLLSLINFWHSPNITASLSVSLKVLPLFLVLSVCGTLFLMAVCKKIKECNFFEFWGRNSLVVYALHFTPLVFFFSLFYTWIQPTSIIPFIGFVTLLLATEYVLCFLLMKLFQYKPFKWLLGCY